MSGDRIFLLAFGAVLAGTRSVGIVAPGFFGRFAATIWRAKSFQAWLKVWALVAMGLGALGLYLAWEPLTVQAIATSALSLALIASGVALLAGWVLRFADKVIQLVSDAFVCRVMCSMAVVIGLLLIALAIS
jgi:polyferredoxin